MEPAYVYRASCTRVVDGDTFVLALDLGFRVGVEIHGRLHGVDAPELPTPEGKAAKGFAMAVLPPSAPLIVRSYRDEQSFARWVVDVWLLDGALLADVLVAAGHARRI
jgi:micrococcal nuclease